MFSCFQADDDYLSPEYFLVKLFLFPPGLGHQLVIRSPDKCTRCSTDPVCLLTIFWNNLLILIKVFYPHILHGCNNRPVDKVQWEFEWLNNYKEYHLNYPAEQRGKEKERLHTRQINVCMNYRLLMNISTLLFITHILPGGINNLYLNVETWIVFCKKGACTNSKLSDDANAATERKKKNLSWKQVKSEVISHSLHHWDNCHR